MSGLMEPEDKALAVKDSTDTMKTQKDEEVPESKPKKTGTGAGKVTEGRFKLSAASEMHWGSDKIVIMAGNKKIVLNKKELKKLLRGLKMHRLGEEKLKELNLTLPPEPDLINEPVTSNPESPPGSFSPVI